MLYKPSARRPFWRGAVGARKEARDSGLEVGAALLLFSTQVSGAGHKDTCLPRWWQRGPSVKQSALGGGGCGRTVVSGRSTLPEAASVPAGPTDGPWMEEPVCRQVSTTQGLLASGGGPGSVLPVPSPVPKFCQGTSGSSIFLCVCDASWRREVVSPVPGALPPTPMAGPAARGSGPSHSPPLPSR